MQDNVDILGWYGSFMEHFFGDSDCRLNGLEFPIDCSQAQERLGSWSEYFS